MPLLGRLAYANGADTQAVLLLRFLLASLCLTAIMFYQRHAWPRGGLALGLFAMGAIGYAGQAFSYFSALHYASASLTALLLYTFPVLVTLIAALFLHEPLTRRKIIALVLASTGLWMTVGDALSGSLIGILFGLGAALIYAVYISVGSVLTPRAGALASASMVMLGGAFTFSLVSLFYAPQLPHSPLGWLAIVAISLISSVVAALAFFVGLAKLGASDSAMLSTFEPVVTVTLAASLMGERLSVSQWIGGAVIIAAVLLLAKSPTPGSTAE